MPFLKSTEASFACVFLKLISRQSILTAREIKDFLSFKALGIGHFWLVGVSLPYLPPLLSKSECYVEGCHFWSCVHLLQRQGELYCTMSLILLQKAKLGCKYPGALCGQQGKTLGQHGALKPGSFLSAVPRET